MAKSKEAIILGHILLMDTQNKLRKSPDAHRHSSKLWWPDAEMLSVVPGEELGVVTLATWEVCCLSNSLQNKC